MTAQECFKKISDIFDCEREKMAIIETLYLMNHITSEQRDEMLKGVKK